MSKRASIEGRIVTYFQTAPLGEARMLQGIIKETMRQREPGTAAPKQSRKKAGRPAKVNAKPQPGQQQPVQVV